MSTPTPRVRPRTEFECVRALDVARQVAAYHIGDPSWADLIVRAYLDPVTALAELEEEKRS